MARFEWSAEAVYGQRFVAPSLSAPAPQMATLEQQPGNSGAVPSAPVPVADGWHRDYRFWVTRQAGVAHPIVHIQGWDGPRHVSLSREMERACKAKVYRWIDQTIERVAAANAKRKGRR